MFRHASLFLFAIAFTVPAAAYTAPPSITVVVPAEAPKLERLAAEELADQCKKLFGADVLMEAIAPADPKGLILIGSPATNPEVKAWVGESWPKLSPQGHVLRTVKRDGKTALVMGGGSPVATLWAVYELAHRFGMRYLTAGDMPPAEPAKFKLEGFDLVIEPQFAVRAFQSMDVGPIGPEAWTLGEHKRLLQQAAKLKFNQVILPVHAWQAFTPVGIDTARKNLAVLFGGLVFPLDDDAPGRTAFAPDTKFFTNSAIDLTGNLTARTTDGRQLLNGIIDLGHQYGMTVILTASMDECTAEYVSEFTPRDVRRALATYYPQADEVLVWSPRGADKNNQTWRWPRPGAAQSAAPAPSLPRLARDPKLWARIAPDRDVIALPLGGNGAIPALATGSVQAILKKLKDEKKAGYCIQLANPADQDVCLHFLARASCDNATTPKAAYEEFINSAFGEGVADRLVRGFSKVEEATSLLDSGDPAFGELRDEMVMKHYQAKGAAPAWLTKAKNLYSEAMDETYRANQRARKVSHEPLFYHAKRLEFALLYLTSLEGLHRASQARDQNNVKSQMDELEKATESLFNAISAQAEIARDNSNRGVIAVANTYGYRPLKAELERVEKAIKDKK